MERHCQFNDLQIYVLHDWATMASINTSKIASKIAAKNAVKKAAMIASGITPIAAQAHDGICDVHAIQ